MTLENLGYNIKLEEYRKEQNLESFNIGRVISEHKERYIVKTCDKEFNAEIVGNLRYSANDRSDFPAVGDWVAISEFGDDKVLIHSVFPRKTVIERLAIGKKSEKQIIATNVDYAFIIQAVGNDFNINRIERYITICNVAKVLPIIIINKIDLINDAELIKLVEKIKNRIRQIPTIPISNIANKGIDDVKKILEKGKTYCLLGSSGVGKSTLLNKLSGKQLMKINEISYSTNKGRHITSHRELFVIENGGIIIDNPGMREVGITDYAAGGENISDIIAELSKKCRFKNCTHTSETGCAVLNALYQGELDTAAYDNFMKMDKEKKHYEQTVAQKRKKNKDFGKMIKNYKKNSKH